MYYNDSGRNDYNTFLFSYMNILSTISYYTPHISGLTICTKRLISGLTKRGMMFTVLTSQHDPSLSRTEKIEGANVVRVPVLSTVGKVPVMPALPFIAWKLVQQSDIVWIHIPQIEGLLVAWFAKVLHKKIIVTVHCLPLLPSGWQRILFQPLFDFINNLIIKLADHVVYYTKDYAENTKELFHDPVKSSYIFPPIPVVTSNHFNHRSHFNHSFYTIGFAGRIAEDKGLEYLLEALSLMKEQGESVKLLIAGPRNAVGEKKYQRKIDQLLRKHDGTIKFLGTIQPEDMADFYRSIDCLVLPSINRAEAFGMVQAEAMKYGVPVVSSNLPGVRVPIGRIQVGESVQPREPKILADALLRVLSSEIRTDALRDKAEKIFSLEKAVGEYSEKFVLVLSL